MSNTQSFLQAFTREVCAAASNDFAYRYDEGRFSRRAKAATPRELIKRWVKRSGLTTLRSFAGNVQDAMDFVAPHLLQLDKLYRSLSDEQSRSLLTKLLVYRVFGRRGIKLPLNTPDFWQGLKQFETLASTGDIVNPGFRDWKLHRIDLRGTGIPLALYSTPYEAHCVFRLEQYACRGEQVNIEAEAGDVVIDGGGCWGDTALYFANKVGPMGRAISFEFVPKNLEIMRKNLELNPDLGPRVEIMERALWERTGVPVSYRAAGPTTKVSANPGAQDADSVLSMSIDDLVAQKHMAKLDLIKMDIEGAELAALKGAEQSLRRFKPKLAICVYHRLQDFYEIPDYLESLGLGYRFFLRHFTIRAEETILFARAD